MKKSVLFLGMGAMLLASCSGNQKKIDIYDQIVMNLPLVVEVFCKNIKFTEK